MSEDHPEVTVGSYWETRSSSQRRGYSSRSAVRITDIDRSNADFVVVTYEYVSKDETAGRLRLGWWHQAFIPLEPLKILAYAETEE